MELDLLETLFALLLLVGLPLLAAGEESMEEAFGDLRDRRVLYLSATASLGLVAGVTWGVATWSGLEGRQLGWRAGGLGPALAWAGAVTAAGLASVWLLTRLARTLGWREGRAVLFLLPRNAAERRTFLLLALAAAVCEEYVYRGFAYHVTAAWAGGAVPAVAGTALSFGLAHGYQRAAGVVRATVLGVLLALPVVATGSLFAAVVAHFWINAIIGLGGWRWLLPEGEGPA